MRNFLFPIDWSHLCIFCENFHLYFLLRFHFYCNIFIPNPSIVIVCGFIYTNRETNWSGGSNWKHCKIDVVRLEFSGAENVEESWAADEIKKCNFCCTKLTEGENRAWATSHTSILLLSRRAFSEAFLLEISQMYATATTIMKINKKSSKEISFGAGWKLERLNAKLNCSIFFN